MKPLWFLRDRSDIRPVALVLAALLASLGPFVVALPLWALTAVWLLNIYLRTFSAFAQHNQAHLKVFSWRPLNQIYDVLLAQCTGYTTTLWELHHVRGHHRHFLKPEDDVASIINPKTGKVFSVWHYALHGNLRIHRDSIRIGRSERKAGRKSLLGALAVYTGLQTMITVALLVWHPWLTLAFFVVPNFATAYLIWWQSHAHHLNVPRQTAYDGSVTVVGRRFNFQTFNIGHHTAHHEKPTLHWAQLPRRTLEIADRIPDVCVRMPNGSPGAIAQKSRLVTRRAAAADSTPELV